MIQKATDILTMFPICKNQEQKQQFLTAVRAYLDAQGYTSRIEDDRNLVVGDPERVRYLITAHYPSGSCFPGRKTDNAADVITILEIARTLPEIHRHLVCFVLFDRTGFNRTGSAAFRAAHSESFTRQMVFHLDGIGCGNRIVFYPVKQLQKDSERMKMLRRCTGRYGARSIAIANKESPRFSADYKKFPLGIGVTALRKKKEKFTLEETNVNILRAALTTIISSGAAE